MARKKKPIIAVDCETDPFLYGRVPAPFVWGVYDGESFYYFWGEDCTEKFIDFLLTCDPSIIYAHNGGKFDYHFLLEYLDPELKIINGRIAKASLFENQHELRDSYLILPLPLSANQKDEIDYGKMEKDQREYNKTEIVNYLKTDCLSLYNWVSDFRNEFGSGLTLAGSAFKQLQKTDYPKQKTYDSYDTHFRQFYFGGRVQCFQTGSFYGDYKYVDINSAYPYAMMFPHWEGSQYVEHLKLPEKENGSWFAIVDAVSKGALPYRGEDNKLYFPDDNKTRRYYASGWEIIAGLETGTLEIKKVIRSFRPLFTHDFSDYVNKFFAMKKQAEENNDKTRRQFAKLMLNSCYGKFGQDGRRFERFCILPEGESPKDSDIWDLYAMNGSTWIHSTPDPAQSYYNVSTAASITGFVRAYLWKAIQASEQPLYCDTDSIICKDFHGDIGKELGQWDLEAEATEAHVAQRKMYAMRLKDGSEKVASKGVRLNFDQIKRGVETGESIHTERMAPAFSLKYGARFIDRKTDFSNIAKNACTNPN